MANTDKLIWAKIEFAARVEEERRHINPEHLIGRSINKPLRPLDAKKALALYGDGLKLTKEQFTLISNIINNKGKKITSAVGRKFSKATQPVKTMVVEQVSVNTL